MTDGAGSPTLSLVIVHTTFFPNDRPSLHVVMTFFLTKVIPACLARSRRDIIQESLAFPPLISATILPLKVRVYIATASLSHFT